jgi:N-acetyl sugar amidotransferase
MKRCKICITPDSYPGSSFNEDGICKYCVDHQIKYKTWDETKTERKEHFEKIIESARKKNKKYDVLVSLSGGKDSTYVLYLASKVYNLKVLCYTFDNGLQSQIARDNIQASVDATGADLHVFRPDKDTMMRLYRHFIEHTGMFCPVCMRGIYAGQFWVARKYDIPLVFKGTSARTEERLVPEIFQDGRLSFFKNVLKRHPFEADIKELSHDRTWAEKFQRAVYLLSKGKIAFGRIELQVPDYVDWNYQEIYETIVKHMGWKPTPQNDDHIDCFADPIVHYYVRGYRLPDLTPNTLKYSAEIRVGQIDRNTALQNVDEELKNKSTPKEISYFLEKLNLSKEQFDKYMQDGKRHMQYQNDGFLMNTFNYIYNKISLWL